MKKLIVSLVALMVATISYSQSSMLATLSHDGEISTFYGTSALKDAHAAAEDGDIITLSSGSFNAVDITKGVTIRGAGMGIDKQANTEPTVIIGDFKINIPETVTERFTLEGIYHNHRISVCSAFKNGTFLKSRLYYILTNGAKITNLTMIHCRVADQIEIPSGSSVSCVNCVISSVRGTSDSSYEFLNCYVSSRDLGAGSIGFVSFKNCVLRTWSSNDNYLDESSIAYNCVGISDSQRDLFRKILNTTNVMKSYTEVFKTYTGTYNDDETFELTDDAKTNFLGIDGTQIGIYGGNMPFSSTPTNPQITKCNVAAKSTADGKLSVDIIVNGAE